MFGRLWRGPKKEGEEPLVPVNLGDRAKDKISGFSGIVVARTEWLNGCVRITLQPEYLKEGKIIENQSFDIEQIEVTQPEAFFVQKRPTGGPHAEPDQGK
jgi:hypothetical protein